MTQIPSEDSPVEINIPSLQSYLDNAKPNLDLGATTLL